MSKKSFSESLSMKGWDLWQFIKGRKKLVITLVGLFCVKLAFDPEMVALLSGGAVFEGIWALAEYYFKKVELK